MIQTGKPEFIANKWGAACWLFDVVVDALVVVMVGLGVGLVTFRDTLKHLFWFNADIGHNTPTDTALKFINFCFLSQSITQLVVNICTPIDNIGCSENIKNHIFYKPDSNYGALIYNEKESEEKNSNFKFLAGCFAI